MPGPGFHLLTLARKKRNMSRICGNTFPDHAQNAQTMPSHCHRCKATTVHVQRFEYLSPTFRRPYWSCMDCERAVDEERRGLLTTPWEQLDLGDRVNALREARQMAERAGDPDAGAEDYLSWVGCDLPNDDPRIAAFVQAGREMR